jgi:sulfate adenylyltransferase subunit 2
MIPFCNTTSHDQILRQFDDAIYIIRELGAESDNPALLFSGGKDSAVLLHLALAAYAPAKPPFTLLHVDTGHNFPEVIQFRDATFAAAGLRSVIASVEASIAKGRCVDAPSRNGLQTTTLLDAISEHRFDGLLGGARRDEERARAKERVFSHRNTFGQWEPRNQRPELWKVYNARKHPGEHFRVFPLSDWTELDVWNYIADNDVQLPSIYFAHEREVYDQNNHLVAVTPWTPAAGRPTRTSTVRYRTVGDATCTAAIESTAATLADIIAETSVTRISERGSTRIDDSLTDGAMETRKTQGYF